MLSFSKLAALALLSGSLALVHEHKREPGVVYVTVDQTVWVTAIGGGSVETVAAAAAPVVPVKTTSGEAAAAAAATAAVVAAAAAENTVAAVAAASSSSAATSSGSGSTSVGTAGALGVTYTPYANDGTCKPESQIKSDLAQLTGFDVIRIYAVDCNQVPLVYNNIAPGQKLFLGLYDMGSIESGCQAIAAGINNDWDVVHTISVGNELVNSGAATVAQVAQYVATARASLRALGYTGPITTTDTFIATINNPGLCDVGDYVTVNAHAFFDSTCSAENAGKWVLDTIQGVSSTCGGKRTLISESGWPHQGDNNGLAIAGVAEQATAIAAIKATAGNDVILFTAFNDLWKNPGPFAAEQWWGLYGTST